MRAKGKNYLIFTGLFEIIIGVGSILLTLWILSQDISNIPVDMNLAGAGLWELAFIYGTSAFQILAGIVALFVANKPRHYKVCYILGLILILLAARNIVTDLNMTTILTNTIHLLGPVFYFYGATLNKQSL